MLLMTLLFLTSDDYHVCSGIVNTDLHSIYCFDSLRASIYWQNYIPF